jgi:Uma2 family endonuclease
MSVTGTWTTAEQLLKMADDKRRELVRGALFTMAPAGAEHGATVMHVAVPLGMHVRTRQLGEVFGAETGFQIARDPDTVRAPDIAFVRADRLGSGPGKGFFPGAPDLAVEVISPYDRASHVLSKVHGWLDAGCRAVWLVDPDSRTVTVYRGGRTATVLNAGESLTADDLLPGFTLPIAEIFA